MAEPPQALSGVSIAAVSRNPALIVLAVCIIDMAIWWAPNTLSAVDGATQGSELLVLQVALIGYAVPYVHRNAEKNLVMAGIAVLSAGNAANWIFLTNTRKQAFGVAVGSVGILVTAFSLMNRPTLGKAYRISPTVAYVVGITYVETTQTLYVARDFVQVFLMRTGRHVPCLFRSNIFCYEEQYLQPLSDSRLVDNKHHPDLVEFLFVNRDYTQFPSARKYVWLSYNSFFAIGVSGGAASVTAFQTAFGKGKRDGATVFEVVVLFACSVTLAVRCVWYLWLSGSFGCGSGRTLKYGPRVFVADNGLAKACNWLKEEAMRACGTPLAQRDGTCVAKAFVKNVPLADLVTTFYSLAPCVLKEDLILANPPPQLLELLRESRSLMEKPGRSGRFSTRDFNRFVVWYAMGLQVQQFQQMSAVSPVSV